VQSLLDGQAGARVLKAVSSSETLLYQLSGMGVEAEWDSKGCWGGVTLTVKLCRVSSFVMRSAIAVLVLSLSKLVFKFQAVSSPQAL
jgi:hypothetical protein